MRKPKRAKAATARRKSRRPRRASSRAGATELALASLAHEIRTPLNGILAMSELIAAADLPRARARMGRPGQERGRASRASFDPGGRRRARRHGASWRCARSRFACARSARRSARRLRRARETKGLAVDIAIATDLPDDVVGDAVRLRAALENLADNAVKFTERGRVAMTVSARAGAAQAPHDRVRLHRQRHRTEQARDRAAVPSVCAGERRVARRYGGAGLGLVFVRRLAKRDGRRSHGGEPARRGQHVLPERDARGGACDNPRNAIAAQRPAPRKRCACCAPRTIRMRASC